MRQQHMMIPIRCHFSPMANTGQKFIYTGCAKGRVVIYDMLTGKEVSYSPGVMTESDL